MHYGGLDKIKVAHQLIHVLEYNLSKMDFIGYFYNNNNISFAY